MPHTLTDEDLEGMRGDVHHLVFRALEHEERLVSLANRLDAVVDLSPELAGLLAVIRPLCVAAREHRQLAEAIARRLSQGPTRSQPGSGDERVLVVDDSDDARELIAAALEQAGLSVITASNGLEAIVAACTTRPTVILMDLRMPVLNGMEAARLLKAASATRDLRIIAHTATPDLGDGPLADLFVDVLIKPVPPDVVIDAVRRFLRA